MKESSINFEQSLIFQELLNRYVESVSLSLSKFFNDNVSFVLQKLQKTTVDQIEHLVKLKNDEEICTSYIKGTEDLTVNFIVMIKRKDLEKFQTKLSKFFEPLYKDYETSLLAETGNIMAGSFLNPICNSTGLTVNPTVPFIAIDLYSPILNSCISDMMNDLKNIFFIECDFMTSDNLVIKLLVVFDIMSVQKILGYNENEIEQFD